jgi:hypothetical protein
MMAFPRRGRVAQTNLVWQRGNDGQWERHLVRQLKNGKSYWSRLVHVRTNHAVCLHCLSNNVEVVPQDIDDRLMCRDCGVSYTIL